MTLVPALASLLLAAAPTPEFHLPPVLFVPGSEPGILFTAGEHTFDAQGLRGALRFTGTSAAQAPLFEEPLPVRVIYPDGPRPAYGRVRIQEWYPGVDAEWTGRADTLVLRLRAAKGRALRQVRFQGEALQAKHGTLTAASDAPAEVEFELPPNVSRPFSAVFADDGSLWVANGRQLVHFTADGKLDSVRVLPGWPIARVTPLSGGRLMLEGQTAFRTPAPPLPGGPLASAAKSVSGEDSDAFLLILDSRGDITAGTYTGWPNSEVTTLPNGQIAIASIAGDRAVLRLWTPGRPFFDREVNIPSLPIELRADAAGNLYTYNLNRSFTVAGKISPALELLWRKDILIVPPGGAPAFDYYGGFDVTPAGEIILSGSVRYRLSLLPGTFFYDGHASYLHRLSPDGDIVYSEAIPVRPLQQFLAPDGSVWSAGLTQQKNLPTPAQAELRGGCELFASYAGGFTRAAGYAQRRSRAGELLDATYFASMTPLTADRQGRLYGIEPTRANVIRAFNTPTTQPSVECIVDAASREPAPTRVPGRLYIAFGRALGPIAPQTATAAAGAWPTQLAGARVTVDGNPAGLVNAQYGYVTFLAPNTGGVQLQTASGPAVITQFAGFSGFDRPALFTIDGHGSGDAAVLNTNGTVNSRANPAKQNSIVTFYVNGPLGSAWDLEFIPGGLVRKTFQGPAPGLPGLTQINVEIPAGLSGEVAVGVATAGTRQVALSAPRVTFYIE